MEAGEIARELGTPLPTIRKRLERARQILGVTSTKAAARLLAEHEGRLDHPRLYQPMTVAPEEAAGSVERPSAATAGPWWRRPNDLTSRERHVVLGAVLLALVFVFILVSAGLQFMTSFWTPATR